MAGARHGHGLGGPAPQHRLGGLGPTVGHGLVAVGDVQGSRREPRAERALVAEVNVPPLPGPETAVKCPARPYKTPYKTDFAFENAKSAQTLREGPDGVGAVLIARVPAVLVRGRPKVHRRGDSSQGLPVKP